MAKLNPLRWGEGKRAKQISKVVALVNALSDDHKAMSDEQLQARTAEFKQRLDNGEPLDDLLPEAFATVRESAWRVLGQRPYDVQVFGGIALHQGNIAEMKTGEGKTLTSTMPVYLNALTGKGVHIVTVNEYLSRRDSEWMGQVHGFLGVSTGLVHSQQPRASKQQAYGCDITYGTNNEFGFDYLRDNMAWEKANQTQRGHYMALVDEVDSILVDEARTPLIISGPVEQSAQLYQVFARRIVPNLRKGEEISKPGGIKEVTGDYVVDEAKRTVAVNEEGIAKVEKLLNVDNLYESVNTPLIHHLNNALKARELFKRDREYIVSDGEVKIVDENTGRVLEGRRYSEGLHQAIEAKENVKIKEENQTLATITLQNYYRTYDKLAGMTGTAKTEEVEFLEIYALGVVEVPTNRDIVRLDQADLIYKTEKAKFEAVVEEIVERHEKGQPLLVGTVDVAKSEALGQMLTRRGIKHEVLNAKNHTREAHIVAQAGQFGAVTVSTNMAGRGTDIILGGNAEELAKDEVAKLDPETPEQDKLRVFAEAKARFEREFQAGHEKVLAVGGLYVIGTERHDSRRIDNQLRGRSGRQGDPGESRFFLSLGDDLMRLFNASAVERVMTTLKIPEDVPIEHNMVTKAVANAQRQVESRNFDIRKNVLKYDDVLNEQRKIVYGQRQRLIDGDPGEVGDLAQRFVDQAVEDALDAFCAPGVFAEDWDLEQLEHVLKEIYDCGYDFRAIDLATVTRETLHDALVADIDRAIDAREEEVGGEKVMRELERRVILSVVDRKWREHLYEMDALRDGIGLRAVGQRDPLTEYQREAYDAFTAMMTEVRAESVTYFFRLPVQTQPSGDPDQRPATGSPVVPDPKSIVGAAPATAPSMGAAAPAGAPAAGAASSATAAPEAVAQVTFSSDVQPTAASATPSGASYSVTMTPRPAAPADDASKAPADDASKAPADDASKAPADDASKTPADVPAPAEAPIAHGGTDEGSAPAPASAAADADGSPTDATTATAPAPSSASASASASAPVSWPAAPVPDGEPSAPSQDEAAEEPTAQPAPPPVGVPEASPLASVLDVGGPSGPSEQRLSYSGPSSEGGAAVRPAQQREDGTHVRQIAAGAQYVKDDAFGNAGRNEPCPCGSGRKYKKCHGAVH